MRRPVRIALETSTRLGKENFVRRRTCRALIGGRDSLRSKPFAESHFHILPSGFAIQGRILQSFSIAFPKVGFRFRQRSIFVTVLVYPHKAGDLLTQFCAVMKEEALKF